MLLQLEQLEVKELDFLLLITEKFLQIDMLLVEPTIKKFSSKQYREGVTREKSLL